MSAIIKTLKSLLLLAILAPAILWLDQTFGPGYTKSMQQQILADLNPQSSPQEQAAQDQAPQTKEPEPNKPTKEKAQTDNKQSAQNQQLIPIEQPNTADKATAKTTNSTLQGIDISHFQGDINWQIFTKNHFDFVFVKATGGETFVDPKFSSNWHALRTTHLARGAYHFFYASDVPKKNKSTFLPL